MLMVDREGIPLSLFTLSANEAEVNAVETLVDVRMSKKRPERLMYDKAADADWLRENLKARNVELICPHRRGRKKPATQDGRPMRRYKRRNRVERTISWLFNFRRLVVRYEWYPELFEGFAFLGCLFTVMKRL
jgi:transposase